MSRGEHAGRVRDLISREPFEIDCDACGNLDLFCESLVHDSILNEAEGKGLRSYERLEWLGDAVVLLAVSDHIYRACDGASEGKMTGEKAMTVSNDCLGSVFRRWGLDRLVREALLTGNGVLAISDKMLGSVFEAMIGASYISFGFERAKGIVEKALYGRK